MRCRRQDFYAIRFLPEQQGDIVEQAVNRYDFGDGGRNAGHFSIVLNEADQAAASPEDGVDSLVYLFAFLVRDRIRSLFAFQ